MNNFKDFIKNKKDLLFGISLFYFSSIFMLYFDIELRECNIDFIHRLLILASVGISFNLWKKGFDLVFSKDKHRE